jgi:hypothetical protein
MLLDPNEIQSAINSFIQKNNVAYPDCKLNFKKLDKVSNLYFLKEILESIELSLFHKEPINFNLMSVNAHSSYTEKPPFPVAHKSIDYHWLFLHYLNVHFDRGKSLIDYIDEFLLDHKEQLNIRDIGITQSGATRAKTYIRFAVNDLRKIGLVGWVDINGKRSWQPTIMGIIMLLYALMKNKSPECFYNLETAALLKNNYVNKPIAGSNFNIHDFLTYDRRMLELISEYKIPGNFYGVMKELIEVKPLEKFKEVFEKLQVRYTETIIRGMQLQDNDAIAEKKAKERFNQLSEEFHQYLATKDPEREKIFDKLHEAYIRCWSDFEHT